MSLKCIAALIKNTTFPHRVIWIDNGSDVNTWESIADVLGNYYEDLIWIRNEENLFYAKGTNQGLERSESEFTVCLSNDVFVSPGWLTKMVKIMDAKPSIGILSPLTDNISGGANVKRYFRQHLLPGMTFNAVNDTESQFRDVTGNVALFCGMIRRSVLDKVGYLDETFFICGNDDDYNDRVRLAGFRTGVALNVYVGHYHSVTKNEVFPDRAEIKARHRTILKDKRQYRLRTGDFRK
jgi:GT2 family glycosyltransferase